MLCEYLRSDQFDKKAGDVFHSASQQVNIPLVLWLKRTFVMRQIHPIGSVASGFMKKRFDLLIRSNTLRQVVDFQKFKKVAFGVELRLVVGFINVDCSDCWLP
jgi:hypothetical protein